MILFKGTLGTFTISNTFDLLCEIVCTLYQRDYLQEYDV